MSETVQVWMEISFNIIYLIAIWGLVLAMTRKLSEVDVENRRVAGLLRWAFLLLALGDTGHVGFRVWAYASGGLETSIVVGGRDVGLVGMGALATAITVTLFYVLLLEAWRVRNARNYGWLAASLLVVTLLRFLLMIPSANQWNSVVPPSPWGLIRNAPLMVLGLGVAYLILRDARAHNDRTFTWIGVLILASYACYAPVIFFVRQVPAIGMLMIPKTMAYVGMAIVAYRALFTRSGRRDPIGSRVPVS